MKSILTQSKEMSHEYCASIVRVGELLPIDGSDFLAQTIIDGYSVVVRKDEVHTGDIMFYASNETVLNKEFLKVNNQFEIGERSRNANYIEVEKLLEESAKKDIDAGHLELEITKLTNSNTKDLEDSSISNIIDTNIQLQIDILQKEINDLHNEANALYNEAKAKTGFFNKHGRVKMVTLRKCPSLGYLFSIDAMAKYCPDIVNEDLEKLVDDPEKHDFDTVNGELFIKVYVPNIQTPKLSFNERKRLKKIQRFDRLIDGEFKLHYDTEPLNKNMYKITPDTKVTISVKLHGTSAIFANVKVKNPKTFNTPFKKLNNLLNNWYIKFVPKRFQTYSIDYGNVYSSRTVIKNKYINGIVTPGYYNTDIWSDYNEIIKPYLNKGMTIYGEIIGYISGSEKMIQKNYDYGCKPGTNKLMIYRITTETEGSKRYEWNVADIQKWTNSLIKENPDLQNKIHPIDILYHDTLGKLYPELNNKDHWHANILEKLKIESKFNMDKKEPLCNKKVPREGIVLRIDDDPINEAFKLKCNAFLKEEGKLMDKGEVDIEMDTKYNN